MTYVRRILCPIDFSEASDAALSHAAQLASQLSADLVVLHTWQLSAYASPTSDLAKESERALIQDMAEALARAGTAKMKGLKVTTQLRLGPAAETIAAVAREVTADQIVMGTTGKTGIERFLVGSVAEQVVRVADVPVTTVRFQKKA